jgi:alkanesulfonate monooxygenase SsuD/methylene tetrahydromethanopterin reductase-like flavin-dependent oxidoreductase (luciferase family)
VSRPAEDPHQASGSLIGVRLPTLDAERPSSRELRSLAQRAEELGFDSLWCLDHLLPSRHVFDSATWDPLTTIPFVAGCTDRIKLGTSVLVVPLRHRLWLLKQLGTLSALAGERMLLGVGVGYDEREFAAAGADRRTRGRALDDVLGALTAARRDGFLTYGGYLVSPPPSSWGAILVGGGGSLTVEDGDEPVRMSDRVLSRIARSDGWLARSSSPTSLVDDDRRAIAARRVELGLEPDFTLVRAAFLHVSLAARREHALAEQVGAMRALGWEGTAEHFADIYPAGTIAEIVERLRSDVAAGVGHFILHPVGDAAEQLERLARHIVPALRSAGESC